MPRVTPLYYHYSNESSICDAFDDTRVQYINDTLHIIRSVFKTPINTLYQICVSFAVQYMFELLSAWIEILFHCPCSVNLNFNHLFMNDG